MPQYFDPAPAVPSRPHRVGLRLPDLEVELASDRGVFSAGGIDTGTHELLRAGSPGGVAHMGDPRAEVMDLGCGYGPLTVALAHRFPASTVWALDVNARARELTEANASRLGLTNVAVRHPDDVPPSLTLAGIWSNPPIRIGKAALQGLLASWLGRLEPDAHAWLVVHKHLGSDSLAAWLSGRGHHVWKAASRKGYRILRVSAPTLPAGE